MKTVEYYWDSPDLAAYRKEVPPGEFLFKKGEEGSTMFIIVRGIAELISERDGEELLVNFVESGEFLGEKAVLSTAKHQRVFGARARTPLTYLELGLNELSQVEEAHPQIFKDMLKQMFLLAARRLVHSNHLSRSLRPSDNILRLINLILQFGTSLGMEKPAGMLVPISVDKVRYYIDMKRFEIEECLSELEKQDILLPQGEGFYLLKDTNRLLESAPRLRDCLPTLSTI